MLTVKNLVKYYGEDLVLGGVSLTVDFGEKAGLVGVNGAGKSTLLKIIAGIEKADDGKIDTGKTGTIGFLRQEFSLVEEAQLIEDYITASNIPSQNLYKVDIILDGLDFPQPLRNSRISDLSGGQKSKLLLALALLDGEDILLLDEPTNNLDLDAIMWLENYLIGTTTPMIIVSHDRRFLNKITTKILEIDEATRKIKEYAGNYDFYHEMKRLELEHSISAYEQYQTKVASLEADIRQKKQWAMKGQRYIPKDNDKFDKGFMRDRSKSLTKSAKSLERKIGQLEKVDRPDLKQPLKIEIDETKIKGSTLIRLTDLVCGYNDGFQTKPITFDCQFGERVVILGKNGTGKSTLIKTISGEIPQLSGDISIGTGIRIGYISQDTKMDTEKTVSEYLLGDDRDKTTVFTVMKRFNFPYENRNKLYRDLSPGERTRVMLARFALNGVNTLLLDEPTNHLDIEALEALEELLTSFSGSVILASHDRSLIEKIHPTKQVEM